MPWAAHPFDEHRTSDDQLDPTPVETAVVGDAGSMRVVGLGARCDLRPRATEDQRRISFEISEFAVLEDGRHLTLHHERGFSSTTNGDDIWAYETVESITHTVLAVVLPDDAEITGEDHPWEWLASLLRAQGLDSVAQELRNLPYEVVLTERVLERLSTGETT